MPEHQQNQQSKKPDTIFQKQTTSTKQIPISNPMAIIQRAKINPKSLTHADVMQLQRTIGNRAVGMLLTGIGNTSTVQQATVQRQEISEEETCPSCMQRQEIPEEEESLQGKMIETIQRQEIPEEEEPLQGKIADTFQRQEIPEEEEPLQGKMTEIVQRQEILEEEEPLQGKMVGTIQCQDIPEEEEPVQGKMAETIQRQEIPEEEEPLQGKFESKPEQTTCPSCVQRQEIPEEEEPLQGKMIETIQRQEIPEEEEPVQGKMAETVQRQDIPEEEEPLQGRFKEPIQRQEIPEEEEPLQGKFENSGQITCPSCSAVSLIQRQEIPEEEEPLKTKRENNTGMPDNLKAGVENLSGIDMSDVRVHYNSDKPKDVGALAYTQGTDIHVAPGQERHLPHEAWHVVQQMQGRVQPTMQLKDMSVNDDEGLEREADEMGEHAKLSIQEKSGNLNNVHRLKEQTYSKVSNIIQGFWLEKGNEIVWVKGGDNPPDTSKYELTSRDPQWKYRLLPRFLNTLLSVWRETETQTADTDTGGPETSTGGPGTSTRGPGTSTREPGRRGRGRRGRGRGRGEPAPAPAAAGQSQQLQPLYFDYSADFANQNQQPQGPGRGGPRRGAPGRGAPGQQQQHHQPAGPLPPQQQGAGRGGPAPAAAGQQQLQQLPFDYGQDFNRHHVGSTLKEAIDASERRAIDDTGRGTQNTVIMETQNNFEQLMRQAIGQQGIGNQDQAGHVLLIINCDHMIIFGAHGLNGNYTRTSPPIRRVGPVTVKVYVHIDYIMIAGIDG
jgi:hypothetical protein